MKNFGSLRSKGRQVNFADCGQSTAARDLRQKPFCLGEQGQQSCILSFARVVGNFGENEKFSFAEKQRVANVFLSHPNVLKQAFV